MPPIDPASSPSFALAGRVATLDAAGTVLDAGVVYARDGSVVEVLPAGAPPPAGFEQVPVTRTGGTIYPGLIELHNHLPYDVLALWPVPDRYTNRDQWSGTGTPQYKQLISAPMRVLGADPEVVPAIVRYVEVRALLGGTTTSQGVALAKTPGIISHFRGLVRNVESTGDPQLPPASTHISDIEATDAEHFLGRISGRQKLVLHLSEGTDSHARDAFRALHLPDGRWAITENLIGIHCLALTAADFRVLQRHGGSMVWSPLSNLLLYGRTADLAAARAAGVPVALGSDWAPSGSKNLLGELKAARLAAQDAGVDLTDLDLVRMVTSTPAQMLGWGDHLGSLQAGRRADLVVVGGGTAGDPYTRLVDATEADLTLVAVNGDARVGTPGLMHALCPPADHTETITVGGRRRLLRLAQVTADPSVAALSVRQSLTRLEDALAAMAPGHPGNGVSVAGPAAPAVAAPMAAPTARAFGAGVALLAASQVVDNHMSPRPHLPLRGRFTGPDLDRLGAGPGLPPPPAPRGARRRAAAAPLPTPRLRLDPLTAVDNPAYYRELSANTNLPATVRDGLAALAPH